MKKIILVLSMAVIGLSFYSFGKAKENKELSHLLSGQYAKKMAEATEKLEELDTAVEKTLLFQDPEGSAEAREDIWRLSSDVKNAVGSLPLDRGFSSAWMNYLGRLGNFARESERTGDYEEYNKVMSQASTNLRDMSDEWQLATIGLINGNMSVSGWANQLDSIDVDHDWSGMRNTVMQYTESDFPLTASESDYMNKKELRDMTDEEVSEDEAIHKFKELFPEVSNAVLVVEESMPGSPYPFYHIRFAEGDSVGYLDITKKGGHVLSYLAERPFRRESLSYPVIEEKAEQFLSDFGYSDTVLEEVRENDTAWHFVYLRVEPEHEAKVFSDAIHMKIAKDTGGIVGFDATEYIRKESFDPQKVKEIDWKKFFQSNVKVANEELAYVENNRLEQRLAYNLTVVMEKENKLETYTVIVDTETSEVIKTEKQQ